MLISALIFILFAVSLDSFFVALTYGIKGIKLSVYVMVLMTSIVCSFFAVAGYLGQVLADIIAPEFYQFIGAGIFLLLGMIMIYSVTKKKQRMKGKVNKSLWPPNLLKVLKKPLLADLDKSGNINGMEIFLISFALSLDSATAGLSISLLWEMSVGIILLMGTITFICLFSGMKIGERYIVERKWKHLNIFPGLFFIGMGLFKIFVH
ncbi:manganese efflux pump [Saliterribacillus persicus]|uniref:Putative sporulation protein YtaF n=1 Tax=Saliterribacillus persicus TaxID=930114 RepID=A0A368XGK8_9BACI|nr:manganese efflux pump [Saliterribacillus persicus]RCW66326.1 putative sporulation protein YtaF [Saliterribacillus persicus]